MIKLDITIHEPAQRVWEALTLPEQMREWYFSIPDFQLQVGHLFEFYEPGGQNTILHRCVIQEIIPVQRFVHTWSHPTKSKGDSLVTWELEAISATETRVHFSHAGTENFADAGPDYATEQYRLGWQGFLAILKNYCYGLRNHVFRTTIQADASTIWRVLWQPETYTKWNEPLGQGMRMKGTLANGARIHLLDQHENGMYSDVVFYAENQFVYFQHIGIIEQGQELPIDAATERWSGAFENYKLLPDGTGWILEVDVDLDPAHQASYCSKFPDCMQRIKELAENR